MRGSNICGSVDYFHRCQRKNAVFAEKGLFLEEIDMEKRVSAENALGSTEETNVNESSLDMCIKNALIAGKVLKPQLASKDIAQHGVKSRRVVKIQLTEKRGCLTESGGITKEAAEKRWQNATRSQT